jgi:hypothetical protein
MNALHDDWCLSKIARLPQVSLLDYHYIVAHTNLIKTFINPSISSSTTETPKTPFRLYGLAVGSQGWVVPEAIQIHAQAG